MKLVLCKNNSEWGVQTFPMRENEYDIGVTFDSEEIKQDYLGKKIFWPNYLEDIKKNPDISKINTLKSSDSATFRFTLKEINDMMIPKVNGEPMWKETQETIQNKDFMASYDEVTGLVKYWAISVSSVANGMYQMDAKLDEFANYDVRTNWKHSRQSHILQATTQDYYKDKNGKYHTLNGLNNWNSISEEFDNSDDSLFIPMKVEEINFDYEKMIKDGHNNPNYEKINDELNSKENWKIVVFTGNTFISGKAKFSAGMNVANGNDKVFLAGLNIFGANQQYIMEAGNELPYFMYIFNMKEEVARYGSDNSLLQLLTHTDAIYSILDIACFPFNNDMLYKEMENTFDWDDKLKTCVMTKFNNSSNWFDPENVNELNPSLFVKANDIGTLSGIMAKATNMEDFVKNHFGEAKATSGFSIGNYRNFFNKGLISKEYSFDIDWDKIIAKDGEPFKVYSKTKLLKSAYKKIRISGVDLTDWDVKQEWLDGDRFRLVFSMIPNIDNMFLGAKILPSEATENTLYKGTNDDYRNGYVYKEFGKNANYLVTSAYQTMIANEQNSINQQAKINNQNLIMNSTLGAVNLVKDTAFGVLGSTIGGGEHAKSRGIMGGVGGFVAGAESLAQGVLSSEQAIGSLNAKIKDAKQSPNKISSNGFSLLVNKASIGIKPQLIWLSLPPANINQIGFHFHKFGVKLGIEEDINKFLDTHKYWDYIQATDLFEIFDRELSTQIRQNICGAMSRGITLFHIRKDWETTFKGIRNYDTANPQMSDELIGSFNDWN